jgi:hypothetical protein
MTMQLYNIVTKDCPHSAEHSLNLVLADSPQAAIRTFCCRGRFNSENILRVDAVIPRDLQRQAGSTSTTNIPYIELTL